MIEVNEDQKSVIVEAESVATKLSGIVITNNDEYANAGEILKTVAGKIKRLEEMRLEKTRPLDKLKKEWMEWFNKPLEMLKSTDRGIRQAMQTYYAKQETKRREEERILREQAEKEAEKIRKQAERAEAKGKDGKAEMLKEKAEQIQNITPMVANKVEQVKGISMRKTWKFEIVDAKKIPPEFTCPDEKKIRQYVNATKGEFPIAGIRIYSEEAPSVRSE